MIANSDILIRPIMSEKSNQLSEQLNKYVFQVSISSNKINIKQAIEDRFNVKVKSVSTIRQRGKLKNTSIKSGGKVIRTSGYRKETKKAIITLVEGQKIDLVGGDV
tara:strand:- start:340 stop:657 length:318 start_codon:yes stop_codon:yes gene_type:complete